MATYVMSDAHGYKAKFDQMLTQIEFCEVDTLYFLGDAIDRGPDGIEILKKIRKMPNIRVLLGNHEHMLLSCFGEDANAQTISNWMRNGGRQTVQTFLKLPLRERGDLLSWLHKLPAHMEINVNGQDYYLVHGWPAMTIRDEVWGRPMSLSARSDIVPHNAKLIIGHTPVALLRDDADQESYFRMLEATRDHMHILRTPSYIDIDCGCGYDVPGASLACLRLDDMAEFYV